MNFRRAREPIVAISADAAAKHQDVVNVMESARLAGYNHISFTTQRR
jgi:biopolymer transport protein ExbD